MIGVPASLTGADRQSQRSSRVDVASFGASAQTCLDRAFEALRTQQQAHTHWVGTLSSSALATSLALAALQLVDPVQYVEPIRRGRGWLFTTQATDGGWGDAVIDPTNINATSLALGALTLTTDITEGTGERQGLDRGLRRLKELGGWTAVGDPKRCTLSGPARTVAALAGLMDWRKIKRLRPEVLLLPTRLRRTISTTFPAYLSISSLHASKAPHPLNLFPTYRLARTGAVRWLERVQVTNGSFEESAFLTSVIIACMVASGQ
ncbi:MAG: Prenyltransferase/squalene oxidase, partial [Chloroflexi bacterium]|nr:Prenyltransferase/squalene oxidase [Chloroflexota bacterium]